MSNVLSEAKKQQVIALGRLGWPLRRIEQETGVRRETAGAYLKAAGIGVRPPRMWGRRPPAKPANEVTTGSDATKPANTNTENLSTKGRAKAETAKPANENEVTTGFGVELSDSRPKDPKRALSTSFCEPFRDAIELSLSRDRNATAIWQDLVSESGFRGGYQTVKRFVRKLRGNPPLQPRAVILTTPGEEAQVDYGTGPMVRDPQTGKYRRTRLFVLTLGCSRKAVRLLSFRSSSRIWAELHEKAFRRLGGSTRVVVLDNLREGVLVADMFAEEKSSLLPLPLEPFRYYQHGQRVVHLDGCVEVEAAYYGLPPGWIGRLVRVQWDELYVRILDPNNGLLLREHVRQKRGWYRIKEQDHPKQRPLRVSQLLWRAGRAGTHIGTLCNLIYNQLGEAGVRRVLGVLSLTKKFGLAAVEDACAAALEMGVHEYRFVRRYLERGPQLTLRQVDPLIRELVQYRDLINLRTQEPEE